MSTVPWRWGTASSATIRTGYGAAHLRQEQALLCGNCHAARENSATVVCNAAGKACVDCHDPHQSDTRYLLKGPQYTMR